MINSEQMNEKRLKIHLLLKEVAACDPERLKLVLKIYEAYLRGDENTRAAILAEAQKQASSW